MFDGGDIDASGLEQGAAGGLGIGAGDAPLGLAPGSGPGGEAGSLAVARLVDMARSRLATYPAVPATRSAPIAGRRSHPDWCQWVD